MSSFFHALVWLSCNTGLVSAVHLELVVGAIKKTRSHWRKIQLNKTTLDIAPCLPVELKISASLSTLVNMRLHVTAICTALLVAAEASFLRPPVLPLVVRNPYLSTWLSNAREPPWTQWPMFYEGQSVRVLLILMSFSIIPFQFSPSV